MSALAHEPIQVTEPGVYPDMAEEIYLADPVPGGSLSSTGARRILPPGCPAIFNYEQGHRRASTIDMQFGSAAHRVLLGVGPEIVKFPKHDARFKAGKVIREQWNAAEAAGKIPVIADDFLKIEQMVEQIRRHPLAGALFDPTTGSAEQSLFWQEPIDHEAPIWCRARLDWLPEAANDRIIFPDYKTTDRLDDESIMKTVAKWLYHQQVDFYERGVTVLGLAESVTGVLVMQMKDPPFLVRVVNFDTDQRRVAWGRNEAAIHRYAECKRTNEWPAYGDGLHTTSLPPWVAITETEEYVK